MGSLRIAARRWPSRLLIVVAFGPVVIVGEALANLLDTLVDLGRLVRGPRDVDRYQPLPQVGSSQ